MNTKRLLWLDCLRGIALFLVIFGHSIERYQTGVGKNIVLDHMDTFIYGFHMMLFFMISGYLYGLKEEKLNQKGLKENFGNFTKNKLIDLGIPYIIFAILVWVGKFIFSSFVKYQVDIMDLLTVFVNPVAFTWFLYILLWVSVIIKGLDVIIKNRKIVWMITLLMVVVACLFETNIKLIDRVLFYTISYYTGTVIYKNFDKICKNNAFIFTMGFVFIAFSIIRAIRPDYLYLKAVTGVTGSVFLMIIMCNIGEHKNKIYNFMVFCGEITIFLYILHPVVLSGVKVLLGKAGITNCAVWLFVLVVSGYVFPIMYYFFGKKIWILDAVFRPGRYLHKK